MPVLTDESRTITYHDGEVEATLVLRPSLRGRSILRDTDLAPEEILAIIETAVTLKHLRERWWDDAFT